MKLHKKGVFLSQEKGIIPEDEFSSADFSGMTLEEARKGTIAYGILSSHNTTSDMEQLQLKFDALASHDITYVGIVQTAKASQLERFPVPYVLTNCHNTLCAVGGTINEDDHLFGLSAARKYGGIYLPPHMGVIHQYMRETMAGCGKMILGSDSHTRYGALGTMAIGEGGGELVKQILEQTYDVAMPEVVGVYLTGAPKSGVGPQDIAIALITATFSSGYVKNKVLEFIGPGVSSMSTDYRNGVDVMTTETTCLSSIWRTDEDTKEYLTTHGRGEDYCLLNPEPLAYYDGFIEVDLSAVKSMIALPFHPSNGFAISDLKANMMDILHEVEKETQEILGNPDLFLDLRGKVKDGNLHVDQGIVAGCAGGTYSNLMEVAEILKGGSTGSGVFNLSVYPSSQAVMMELTRQGVMNQLMSAGTIIRSAFCGPCFGAGDTPASGGLSIRHTTRNFPNREGAKPGNGQVAGVALMDARSIAATAVRGGILTGADELDYDYTCPGYQYDSSSYDSRVYQGFGKADKESDLTYGPNIKDWPEMSALNRHMLLKVSALILDPVTTTDELIPSGETSSFRSNPLGLAEFTLSRRCPEYVQNAKDIHSLEKARLSGEEPEEIASLFEQIWKLEGLSSVKKEEVTLSSVIYATKPGDGSAREQAASCQRVLGAGANIAQEYATKRYRSNLMNWGMVPFLLDGVPAFAEGDYLFVPDVLTHLEESSGVFRAYILGDKVREITLRVGDMTEKEREIVRSGCLINFNRK